MNLVVILGSGAVGKMTVGQELQKITDSYISKVDTACEEKSAEIMKV